MLVINILYTIFFKVKGIMIIKKITVIQSFIGDCQMMADLPSSIKRVHFVTKLFRKQKNRPSGGLVEPMGVEPTTS